MSKLRAAQFLFLAAAILGVAGVGAVLFLGDGSPVWISVWGWFILAGLLGNAVCALIRVFRNGRKS
jgi:hypothetical protein